MDDRDIVGVSLTWLTRTKLPSEGEMEGKFTDMLTLGVKFAGMMLEGRRFALLSDSINVLVAIVCNISVEFDSLHQCIWC